MDLSDTIIPKSDQINADDLIAGPQTFTVREVKRGAAEQPVDIMLVETERAYRPSKSMRRVLVTAWGNEGAAYAGRKLTLYRDAEVRFGGDKVGGIKISHLSHIDGPLSVMLTATRGSRKPHAVAVLVDHTRPAPLPVEQRIEMALKSFASINVSEDRLEAKLGKLRTQWGAQEVDHLGSWYNAITKDGIDADSLLPSDSRPDALGGAPAVEDGTPAALGGAAPTAMGGVPAPGEAASEQRPAASPGRKRAPLTPRGRATQPSPEPAPEPTLDAEPDEDGVYDVAIVEPGEQPNVTPLAAAKAEIRAKNIVTVQMQYERILGKPVSRDERIMFTRLLVGRDDIDSTNDLTSDDLRELLKKLERTRDRDQLETYVGSLTEGGE